MLHPQKLGLIPIFIGAYRVASSRNMPLPKGLLKRKHCATTKGKTNEKSIVVTTAMLAMNPLGYQAQQETAHNPDNSIAMSTAKNESQRILCTLFPCRGW